MPTHVWLLDLNVTLKEVVPVPILPREHLANIHPELPSHQDLKEKLERNLPTDSDQEPTEKEPEDLDTENQVKDNAMVLEPLKIATMHV